MGTCPLFMLACPQPGTHPGSSFHSVIGSFPGSFHPVPGAAETPGLHWYTEWADIPALVELTFCGQGTDENRVNSMACWRVRTAEREWRWVRDVRNARGGNGLWF